MSLTLETARTIIAAAREHGAGQALKPLTIVVLDTGGNVVAVEREDGASNKRFEIAYGKAHGALALGMGSRALMSRAEQQAYFSGAVKALKIGGSTATYDAVLIGLRMLLDASKDTPDAKLMLFVLSDGQQNRGYSFDRVKSIVKGLAVPVYSISFNGGSPELSQLSEINEAACMEAESENLINLLAGLFNVQM